MLEYDSPMVVGKVCMIVDQSPLSTKHPLYLEIFLDLQWVVVPRKQKDAETLK